MAEPESAVLPITPYPIGCLKLLVKGFPQTLCSSCGRCCQPFWADVQTTKQSGCLSPAADLVTGLPQPLQTALASEQFHRLE